MRDALQSQQLSVPASVRQLREEPEMYEFLKALLDNIVWGT